MEKPVDGWPPMVDVELDPDVVLMTPVFVSESVSKSTSDNWRKDRPFRDLSRPKICFIFPSHSMIDISTMMGRSLAVVAFLWMALSAAAFVPQRPSFYSMTTSLSASSFSEQDDSTPLEGSSSYPYSWMDRRQLFQAAALGTSSFLIPSLAYAEDIGKNADKPIVILGAGGKVGTLCTKLLANQGLYTRAVTRSGRTILDSPYVSHAAGDVTKYDALQQAIQGASGVIFAASASGKKKGGEPVQVDYLGVYNTAKACLDANVPKLAVISAGTVTRPESAGFKATNFFVKYVYGDRIMDSKMAGEVALRELYAGKPNVAYTIIRPGGLSDKSSAGPSKLHLSQGDIYSAEVSREDVARVTVAALLKGKATDNTTFELNNQEGLIKAQGNLPDAPKELVHAGAPTFEQLLDGLLTDQEIKKKYPDIINDFRGEGIPPIEQLAA